MNNLAMELTLFSGIISMHNQFKKENWISHRTACSIRVLNNNKRRDVQVSKEIVNGQVLYTVE